MDGVLKNICWENSPIRIIFPGVNGLTEPIENSTIIKTIIIIIIIIIIIMILMIMRLSQVTETFQQHRSTALRELLGVEPKCIQKHVSVGSRDVAMMPIRRVHKSPPTPTIINNSVEANWNVKIIRSQITCVWNI